MTFFVVPLIDIVIRSYFRDFGWLHWALKSIHTFVRGYRHVILILPESSMERWKDELIPQGMSLQIVTCPQFRDDYLGQQVSKLYADQISTADYIIHVDSDCVFARPIGCGRDLFRKRKPIHIYRRESVRPAIDGWRRSVETVLGIHTDKEFMVAMPAVYPRTIYQNLRQFIRAQHGMELSELVLAQRSDLFSEFSVLGAYAFSHMYDHFTWVEAEDESLVNWPCIQFWSRGEDISCASSLVPCDGSRVPT